VHYPNSNSVINRFKTCGLKIGVCLDIGKNSTIFNVLANTSNPHGNGMMVEKNPPILKIIE
jgi:hypothetical protein